MKKEKTLLELMEVTDSRSSPIHEDSLGIINISRFVDHIIESGCITPEVADTLLACDYISHSFRDQLIATYHEAHPGTKAKKAFREAMKIV